ncbi:Methylesterase [Thalictrum thalictroides]|uniref:Methylesterase n=1 Tax=Thalictrum thalictroides TaxID=46969 RepID=A0A7J6V5K7_THATH|nr:Methylesterase [Thalictrum thalictroides]
MLVLLTKQSRPLYKWKINILRVFNLTSTFQVHSELKLEREIGRNMEERKDEQQQSMENKSKTHFVLVHGIGAGGWCWFKIRCLLEKSGYKVYCPDLKSAGIDPTDPNSILKFEDYNKPLIDLLSILPENDKVILVGHSAGGLSVILVGHSAGGLSVTDAIHRFGKKINVAVYVGATMLRRGFLTDADIKDGVPDQSEHSDKREFQRKATYNMSPEEDATLAWMLSKVGPLQAISGATFSESPEIDEVTRLYIKTLQDHTLKLEQQDAMIKKWPPSDVLVLESDHCPMFSTPSDLFGVLAKVANVN